MIRVMLVDDHAVVRQGYRRLLELQPDLCVSAEADGAAQALEHWRRAPPDVAVIDLSLPGMGGLELIRRIRQRDPAARLLAFSMHCDALWAGQALRAGALGYVTKSSEPALLLHAVREAAQRRRVLSPDVAPEVLAALVEPADDPARLLSPREFEVLRLLVAGRRADEIATLLSLSQKTVHNTHYQIKAKLGVRSDFELARVALRLQGGVGLSPPESTAA